MKLTKPARFETVPYSHRIVVRTPNDGFEDKEILCREFDKDTKTYKFVWKTPWHPEFLWSNVECFNRLATMPKIIEELGLLDADFVTAEFRWMSGCDNFVIHDEDGQFKPSLLT